MGKTRNLITAAEQGKLPVVRCLVETEGARVNVRLDPDGWTPLTIAAAKGHLHVVRYLIKQHQTDIHRPCRAGWTPLHHAAKNGHTQVVEFLLLHQKLPNSVNTQTPEGFTSLHLAKNLETALLLIQHGASLNIRDNHQPRGRTPLDMAEKQIQLPPDVALYLQRTLRDSEPDVASSSQSPLKTPEDNNVNDPKQQNPPSCGVACSDDQMVMEMQMRSTLRDQQELIHQRFPRMETDIQNLKAVNSHSFWIGPPSDAIWGWLLLIWVVHKLFFSSHNTKNKVDVETTIPPSLTDHHIRKENNKTPSPRIPKANIRTVQEEGKPPLVPLVEPSKDEDDLAKLEMETALIQESAKMQAAVRGMIQTVGKEYAQHCEKEHAVRLEAVKTQEKVLKTILDRATNIEVSQAMHKEQLDAVIQGFQKSLEVLVRLSNNEEEVAYTCD